MFGRWEKFDRQFYQPYLLHSSEALQTDVNSNMIRCGFPFRSTFFGFRISMRFVGWNKDHFLFQIVYKFRPVSKSRSLVASFQDMCIFIESVAAVPTIKLNLGMNLIGF